MSCFLLWMAFLSPKSALPVSANDYNKNLNELQCDRGRVDELEINLSLDFSSIIRNKDILTYKMPFTPNKTGGGGVWWPPSTFHVITLQTRKALATTLYNNSLSSFPHILTPNLWCPGLRFRSYITFCTCTSDRKRQKNLILCIKSMQIDFFFFHSVHINMLIFTLHGWN